MTKHCTRAQRDLFEERPEDRKLEAAARAKALEQIQLLLMEAKAIFQVQPKVGDDQDHA